MGYRAPIQFPVPPASVSLPSREFASKESIRFAAQSPAAPRVRAESSLRLPRIARSASPSRLNQLLYRARHVFDRHVRINAMLIEQVDCLFFNRFSDPSTAFLICSGLLFSPAARRCWDQV